jgi:hypothetical protein
LNTERQTQQHDQQEHQPRTEAIKDLRSLHKDLTADYPGIVVAIEPFLLLTGHVEERGSRVMYKRLLLCCRL